MKQARLAARSRSRLDDRFHGIGPVKRFTPPVRGWIRAIREGLGMSAAQLGTRLGIKQPSVGDLERSEANGTIKLASLRRVAEALDCTLVYALVPNKTLESMVRERAQVLARRRLSAVQHSMQLEDQSVSERESEGQLDDLIRSMDARRLWDHER
jgi:predicted DNA-binding mobile mystery protein A